LFLWRVRTWLPWFVGYIAWSLLTACAALIIFPIAPRLYRNAYWWMEAVNIVLVVGALRESLLRLFENSPLSAGFRRSLWVVLTGVLAYSVWKAIARPPVQSNLLRSFIIGTEFTLRWGISAVALAIVFYLPKMKKTFLHPEPSVIAGLGLSASTVLIWVTNRSEWGASETFLTQFIPSVGYWFAVAWWIMVFRPRFGLKELGVSPQEALKAVRAYSEIEERISKVRK
jgi:hypothetical protein